MWWEKSAGKSHNISAVSLGALNMKILTPAAGLLGSHLFNLN
jgi:hypothetical protein